MLSISGGLWGRGGGGACRLAPVLRDYGCGSPSVHEVRGRVVVHQAFFASVLLPPRCTGTHASDQICVVRCRSRRAYVGHHNSDNTPIPIQFYALGTIERRADLDRAQFLLTDPSRSTTILAPTPSWLQTDQGEKGAEPRPRVFLLYSDHEGPCCSRRPRRQRCSWGRRRWHKAL